MASVRSVVEDELTTEDTEDTEDHRGSQRITEENESNAVLRSIRIAVLRDADTLSDEEVGASSDALVCAGRGRIPLQ